MAALVRSSHYSRAPSITPDHPLTANPLSSYCSVRSAPIPCTNTCTAFSRGYRAYACACTCTHARSSGGAFLSTPPLRLSSRMIIVLLFHSESSELRGLLRSHTSTGSFRGSRSLGSLVEFLPLDAAGFVREQCGPLDYLVSASGSL